MQPAGWTLASESTGRLRVRAPLVVAGQVNRDAGSAGGDPALSGQAVTKTVGAPL